MYAVLQNKSVVCSSPGLLAVGLQLMKLHEYDNRGGITVKTCTKRTCSHLVSVSLSRSLRMSVSERGYIVTHCLCSLYIYVSWYVFFSLSLWLWMWVLVSGYIIIYCTCIYMYVPWSVVLCLCLSLLSSPNVCTSVRLYCHSLYVHTYVSWSVFLSLFDCLTV